MKYDHHPSRCEFPIIPIISNIASRNTVFKDHLLFSTVQSDYVPSKLFGLQISYLQPKLIVPL